MPGLAGNAKSYAERLFRFPDVGALSEEEAVHAIRRPMEVASVRIEDNAAHSVYEATRGYPYFLQEWGYQLWNHVQCEPITVKDVEAVRGRVQERLDGSFFRVRMERLTKSEKDFLYAMARIHAEELRIGDLAKIMEVPIASLSPRRSSLIKKGMIYSPAYGEIAFTVPLFEEYLNRVARRGLQCVSQN